MPPRYVETHAKSILNSVQGMGFRRSVNPYRGCVHGCHYCFARRYQTYLDLGTGEDFTGVILVKVLFPLDEVGPQGLPEPCSFRETNPSSLQDNSNGS